MNHELIARIAAYRLIEDTERLAKMKERGDDNAEKKRALEEQIKIAWAAYGMALNRSTEVKVIFEAGAR